MITTTREIMNSTSNFTKKDKLNSRTGKALKDFANGSKLDVAKCAILECTNNEGEVSIITCLITTDGECVTSTSNLVAELASDIIELIEDEGSCNLLVDIRKSKTDRDYITLTYL